MTTAPMATTPTETLSVVVEREIPFAPEKIWRALTQPHLIEAWLMKIGAGPGTDPVETIIGRVLTFLYYAFFITMPVWTKLDKTKPVPERVTTHD